MGVDPSKINYVPFKGGGEAIAAIVGGHVTAGISGIGEFAEQVKGGRMRALAVSSSDAERRLSPRSRSRESMSSLPTGAVFSAPRASTRPSVTGSYNWFAAPPSPPPGRATLEKFNWAPIYLSGDSFAKFIEEDTKRIGAIIDSLGIKNKAK